MEQVEIKKIIETLKKLNPYPVDVFPEPSDDDWRGIGNFLEQHGKNPDRIFGKFGRMVWESCINLLEELTQEE